VIFSSNGLKSALTANHNAHAGLSSLTHNTLPHWQSSSSDQQGSSLAQQVGQVMGMPHHQSPAFLLGAGSSNDPDSAILLDTNIQVRIACRSA